MRTLALSCLLALLGACALIGQGTDLGTVRGTVTDASGAVIPNAAVEVLDVATNITRKVTSNAEGNYEAGGLRSGTYKVTVAVEGFTTAEVLNIEIRSGGAVRADVSLKPKGATQTVIVSTDAPTIETESPTIARTLEGEAIRELPRDSRDIYSFLYLNPNITQADTDGAFKFIGAQSYGASFSLDGQRSNGGVFGQPTASQPSLETVGELTVLSNNFTAEYAGIANVRVTTKRGGVQHHGSLFYNNKNAALAAWNLRDKIGQAAFLPTPAQNQYPYPFFNLNEFGASFGGPVPKMKRTFFFMAYERRYSNAPVNLRSTTLPHPTLWTGDFTLLRDTNKPLVPAAVTLTAAEIANNTVGGLGQRFTRLPSRLMNPVTAKLIDVYFPKVNPASPINAANGRLVDYFNSLPGRTVRNLGTVRVDHDFSSNDKFYGVFNSQSQDGRTSAVLSPYVGLGLTLNERTNQTLSLSETHLFSGRLINEVRGGFNRQPTFRRSNQTLGQFLSSIGFDQSDLNAYASVVGQQTMESYGHPGITFGTGFANIGTGGRNTYRPLDQSLITFGDTIAWNLRKHTIRAGADFVRNAAVDGFTSGRSDPRGTIAYSGAGPDAFARFLMGLPANSTTFVNKFRPPMDVHNWETGFFVQDDFKVNSRLTLYLGLRYEVITPFIEANDLLLNFDPTFVGTGGKKGRFILPSQKTAEFADPRFLAYGYALASDVGVGRALVKTDRNNIAPRFGVAYRIDDKMVFRGGYGLFYPTSAAQGIRDPLATNSFQVRLTKRDNAAAPLQGWPGFTHGISPNVGGLLASLSNQISANWVPFDLQSPRIDQYNLTVERQLGERTGLRVSYLGTRMKGLVSGVDANMLPPSDTPFGTTTGDGVTACSMNDFNCDLSAADRARLPFPALSDYMTSFGNLGHGRSHAMQLELNRRFGGGFTFTAAYTLLRQLTSAPDVGASSLGGTSYNQFRPDVDYSQDAFVPRHRFITYGTWNVPFGHRQKFGSKAPKWADTIVGGWQASWQAFVKSGTGFTPFWFCDNCGPVMPGNLGSGSIDATGGFYGTTFRPIVTGQVNMKQGDRIFNPDAFAPPPAGADLFDNPNIAKRNLLWGPGTWGANLGVHKIFRLSERFRADLGADFNNLFNHPLKSPDGFDIGNLGSFTMQVDPKTLKPYVDTVNRNPDFGRLLTSYTQEGVDSRRTIRLKLRVTF
ncbi:MAG: carboxypeptidase regulatory-like domain-containing protein [Acidobacteria bacterium]|nr:carboxypeptidase regulatory-like domain-containing protein [Acidobacteriota bacterium]